MCVFLWLPIVPSSINLMSYHFDEFYEYIGGFDVKLFAEFSSGRMCHSLALFLNFHKIHTSFINSINFIKLYKFYQVDGAYLHRKLVKCRLECEHRAMMIPSWNSLELSIFREASHYMKTNFLCRPKIHLLINWYILN